MSRREMLHLSVLCLYLFAPQCVSVQQVSSPAERGSQSKAGLVIGGNGVLHKITSSAKKPSTPRRHRLSTRIAESLTQGSPAKAFPPYPRHPDYVHPLSAAGQDLEKQAVAKLTTPLAMDYLRQLILEPTRSYTNAQESQKAEHFLGDAFQKMGLAVCFHNFTTEEVPGGRPLTNVVAFIPGSTAETVVLGAHYDSRPFDGNAPGAEDNGSGTAALLAIAHAFMAAGIKPKASVYFVGFAAEEPGLIGSKAFADSLRDGLNGFPSGCKPKASFLLKRGVRRPQDRHKAIIMDEIGWASPELKTPTVNLESYDWCKDVMDHLRESSQVHNGDKMAVVHSNNPFGSDHMSFLDNQMSAVLTINGYDESYPNYHQSTDTIDNVNPQLLTMISRMNLGALIRLAGAQ